MNIRNYKNLKDKLIKENSLLKFTVLIMAILVAYLVNTVITRTNSQRTVFMPPQATYKEFWVSGDQVSQSYLYNIGTFIAYNLLNVSKDNANLLISNILPLVDSSNYYAVKKELQETFNYIIENQLSRTFYIGSVKPDEKVPNRLIVQGSLNDSISTKIIKTEKVKLLIDYKIQYGLFTIINLNLEQDQ